MSRPTPRSNYYSDFSKHEPGSHCGPTNLTDALTKFISSVYKTGLPSYTWAVGNAISPGIHSLLVKLLSCQGERDILKVSFPGLSLPWARARGTLLTSAAMILLVSFQTTDPTLTGKRLTTPSVGQEVEQLELPDPVGGT